MTKGYWSRREFQVPLGIGMIKLARVAGAVEAERCDGIADGGELLRRNEIQLAALVLVVAISDTALPPDSVAVTPARSSAWLTSAASSSRVVSAVMLPMGYSRLPLRRGRCRCR